MVTQGYLPKQASKFRITISLVFDIETLEYSEELDMYVEQKCEDDLIYKNELRFVSIA